MLLPEPGGPHISSEWAPAAAISSARFGLSRRQDAQTLTMQDGA
jgi:hypothetical protein